MWNRVSRISGILSAIGGLVTLIGWMETSRWFPSVVGAMLAATIPIFWNIVSLSILVLIWVIARKMTGFEERLKAVECRDSISSTAVQLSESELLHENMLWRWDGNTALGPYCPRHQDRLLYKPSVTPAKATNFEEDWLSVGGWFICPDDSAELFRVFENMQVKRLRTTVADRFRLKFGLSSSCRQ